MFNLAILNLKKKYSKNQTYSFELQHFFRVERGQDLPQTNTLLQFTFAKSLQKSENPSTTYKQFVLSGFCLIINIDV